jgi:hypothetical protein
MTPESRYKIAKILKKLIETVEIVAIVLPPKLDRAVTQIVTVRNRITWAFGLALSAIAMVAGWCILLALMLDMGRVLPALLDGSRPAAVEVVLAIALWLGCQIQWRFRRVLCRPWGMKTPQR